jgi:colanic acid biosynthesis glycosyl transferase WcaI
MKISIVSINYSPEPTGIAVYTTGMAEYLAANGHDVTVFTAFPYYPGWCKFASDRGRIFATDRIQGVRVKRNYIYVPQKPNAWRRIVHELSFTTSAAIRYLVSNPGAVTIIVTPPLLLATVIGVLAKVRRSKVLLHVQDLQPDAAIDLGMIKPGALTQALFVLEKIAYRLATRISTIGASMRAKIESKGVPSSKCLILKNWANDELIYPLDPEQSLKATLELEGRFVVLYSGNLGVKQGLGMLLDAAALLQAIPSIVFLIVGDGGEKDTLVTRADELGLKNVRFLSPVPRQDLGRLLAAADVSVITQKAGIDDLVLPSKLSNILASERPVVASTQIGSELATILLDFECGVVVRPEDGATLAKVLQMLCDDPTLRAKMGKNGVSYAHANLAREAILGQLMRDLHEMAQVE